MTRPGQPLAIDVWAAAGGPRELAGRHSARWRTGVVSIGTGASPPSLTGASDGALGTKTNAAAATAHKAQ